MISFKPREDDFYSLLLKCAELLCEGSEHLKLAVSNPFFAEENMTKLNEIEHEADEVTRTIISKLNKTLVTPLDREDIYALASLSDDVVDFIQGALEKMIMYKATNPFHGILEMVSLLHESVLLIKSSIDYLPHTKGKFNVILKNSEQINFLESKGDKLYRLEVAKLFEEEKNPIEIIKWKEILEHLEEALDRCEDLSDAIKGVVLKNG